MAKPKNSVQKNIAKLERPSLTKFAILFFFFLVIVQPIIVNYGLIRGSHVVFLVWTFFVLCMPISRGKILVGSPYFLWTGKRLKYPEIITWGIALTGNMLTLATSYQPYLRSTISHLLYRVLITPWPLWMAIILCGTATFYDAIRCNYTHAHTDLKKKMACRALVLTSFIVTYLLTHDALVVIANAHGMRQ